MTALYSINLMVMDNKANLPLAQGESIYHNLPGMLLSGWQLSVLQRCWCCFLQTPAGLAVRATGDNEAMVRSSSIIADRMKNGGPEHRQRLRRPVGCADCALQLLRGGTDGHRHGGHRAGFADCWRDCGRLLVRRATILSGAVATIVGSVLYRLIIAQGAGVELFLLQPQADYRHHCSDGHVGAGGEGVAAARQTEKGRDALMLQILSLRKTFYSGTVKRAAGDG